MVDGLYTKVYYKDEAIIKVGEEGDGIYFILDGVCSVKIDKGLYSNYLIRKFHQI